MMTFGLNQFKISSYRAFIRDFLKVFERFLYKSGQAIISTLDLFYSNFPLYTIFFLLSWWKDFPGLESAANFSNLPSAAALTAMSF